MRKLALIGTGAAAAALTAAAAGAKQWLDLLSAFLANPASTTILIICIALVMGYLFHRAVGDNKDCEARVSALMNQNRAQQAQLDAIYMLLSLDRRYVNRLPSIEDWRAGKFDMRAIVSYGHEPERRNVSPFVASNGK